MPVGTSTRTVGERLAAALLPVLLHRVQNTTQLLIGVRTLLELAPGELPPARADDLVAAGDAAQEQGWLLGVLGASLGADLLLGRHEPRGLEAMLRLVRDAARRNGRDLAWTPTPRLRARGGGGPTEAQLCTAIAALAWTALEELERGGSLALEFEVGSASARLRGSAGAGEALDAALAELAGTLASSALERDGPRWSVALPPDRIENAP
jgi:hypothetical protein